MRRLLVVALALGALLGVPGGARAATIVVTSMVDDSTPGNCNLREAISAANGDAAVDACPAGSGADVIDVPAGTYDLAIIPSTQFPENNNVNGDLDVNSPMSIRGAGMGRTIIDAQAEVPRTNFERYSRVVQFTSGSAATMSMSDVTIQDGRTQAGLETDGGGCVNAGGPTLTLTRVEVRRCASDTSGGAVRNELGTILTLTDSRITEGTAGDSGGAMDAAGEVTIERTSFTNSSAARGGGLRYDSIGFSDLELRRSSITGNTSTGGGGGLALGSNPATIANTTISGNTAATDGGGVLVNSSSAASFAYTTITDNQAADGGGLSVVAAADVDLDSSIVAANRKTAAAGNPDLDDPTDKIDDVGDRSIIGDVSGSTLTTVAGRRGSAASPVDPRLRPLAVPTGQPTASHMPLLAGPASPAIDWGAPASCPAVDQHGTPRPIGAGCDAGAVETEEVPPTTTLKTTPPHPSGSTSATFTYSGSDNGAIGAFQCTLNGSPVTCPTGSLDPSEGSVTLTVPDGSNTFTVAAVDAAGNVDATPESFTWTVDATDPTVTLLSTPPPLATTRTAQFTYSASDGTGVGNLTFNCTMDGTPVPACGTGTTYTVSADGSHTFTVAAVDGVGNTTDPAASYTWTIDTAAPTVQIDDAPPAVIDTDGASVEFSGADTGGTGVNRFECRVDSDRAVDFLTCASPAVLSGLGEGPHTFDVRAVDNAGLVSGVDSTSFTVDTIDPATSLTGLPADATSDPAYAIGLSGDPGTGTAIDDAAFRCVLDGVVTDPCSSPRTGTLADGTHTFTAQARDGAGNLDPTAASHSWVVDTKRPTTTLAGTPEKTTNVAATAFTFSGDGTGTAVRGFVCTVDGTVVDPCTSGTSRTFAEGAHTFSVAARDEAGLLDDTPEAFTWTVDTTAPRATIDNAPSGTIRTNTAEIAFSAEDGAGGVGVESLLCRLDAEALAPCPASPARLTGLADGAHAFEVVAVDRAGNRGEATARFTVDTRVAPPPPPSPTPSRTPAPPCQSQRSFRLTVSYYLPNRIRVRLNRPGSRLVSAVVRSSSNTVVRRLRLRGRKVSVDLRGLTKGAYTIRITYRLTGERGRTRTLTRRFQTCAGRTL